MPQLAITGGEPLRRAPFPSWPIVTPADEAALLEVLHSGRWFLADKVAAFEKAFASFQDAQFGVAVSNGTVALQVALEAIGLQPGDEVIVPAYTFIATASSVAMVGGIPIFADVQPGTYNLCPASVEAALTERTRAIIAVHVAGRPADLDALGDIARRHHLYLIEDSAQAHAAAWRDRKVGAIGQLGTFSFQASKNLNAGEGGFITTDDRRLAERAWSLHNCGRAPKGAWYEHPLVGGNYRLGEFQAGLLLSQLGSLEYQTARRTRNAELLTVLLGEIEGVLPLDPDPRITTHAYHLYIIRYQARGFGGLPRDRFITALQQEGIPCSSGYNPLYREAAFRTKFQDYPFVSPYFKGKPDYDQVCCPEVERICAEEAIWLTQNMLLGPEEDMGDIARAIRKIQDHAGELKS
ncbi:MAG: DegT/DnrJ/EryC1/StrS family aminotransferase [Candidatus Latescibacteria bacterium]|nr:DegT/DnrJ/EryC1/StrS family aminotransferase [Candidatus Latescibacterota bacterium]